MTHPDILLQRRANSLASAVEALKEMGVEGEAVEELEGYVLYGTGSANGDTSHIQAALLNAVLQNQKTLAKENAGLRERVRSLEVKKSSK